MGDFGLSEIIALISAAASVGTGIYQTRAQGEAQQQAMNAQRQAQQQQQQQALAQRRQQTMAEGPSLQAQVSGSLTPQSIEAMSAQLTGNPGAFSPIAGGGGGGSEGGLTPAIENLFPSGGVPSLTEPWPQNV